MVFLSVKGPRGKGYPVTLKYFSAPFPWLLDWLRVSPACVARLQLTNSRRLRAILPWKFEGKCYDVCYISTIPGNGSRESLASGAKSNISVDIAAE